MSKSFFEIRENWASKAQYKNMRGTVKGANKYSGMDKARLKRILSIAQDELDDLQGSRMKAAGGRGLPKGSKQDIADLKDKIANVKAALKESVELDEAKTPKELTPKAVEDYLVKTGVNPKSAKEAVKKNFGYANKKYGGPTYAAALKKVAEVVWSLGEEADLDEALKKDKDDPCWKDYVQLGTKKKNGKEVPNCVPKEEAELQERSPLEAIKVALGKKFNKNYPKAIEWMKKNNKTAADAARMFAGVDARELDKMARG